MNLFKSDKAPAILAIFLAVVGFYVSTVVTEIRSQAVLTYRFDTAPDGLTTLRLENVSLSSLVKSTRFEIACVTLRPDCLGPMPGDKPGFHRLGRVPPVSPANTQAVSSADGAQLTATLVPGAIVEISVQQSKAALADRAQVEFYYTAAQNDPQALLLLDARSATAWFVDNYFDIMIYAFLAALAGLLVLIILPLFSHAAPAAPPENPAPDPAPATQKGVSK